MYRKNNNIFTTMIANQLFSNYSLKQKLSSPIKTESGYKEKHINLAKNLQELKRESEFIQKERKDSMILLCLLEKTIEQRTKKIYKICKNLEKDLSKW